MHPILQQPPLQPRRLSAILLLCLGLAACSGKGDDPKALVEQAKSAQTKGDLNAAAIHLKSAIQADEKNSEARLLLGKLHLARDEYASAEKELSRARSLGQKPEITNPLIARALLGLHEFQRLVDELPLPEEGNPARPLMLAMHAQARLGLREQEEARKLLDEGLKTSPTEAELHFAQARLHISDRQFDQALVSLDQALLLEPDQTTFLLLKGEILKIKGQIAEAGKIYQAIVAKHPNNSAARLSIAGIAIQENRLGDARKEVELVLKNTPNHVVARYTLALLEFRNNQYAKARDELAPVLRAAPNYPPANLLAGAVEYSLGSMEAAETQLKKVLSAYPSHDYAVRLLAASQVRRGQIDAADNTLRKLNPEQSNDAATLIVAGEVAMARKNFQLAEKYYAKAAALRPDSPAIRTELGLTRMALGDAAAISDLQAGASMDVESSRADTLLILNLLKRKDFDAALSAIDRLEKKMPRSPQPANYRGAVLMGKNDPQGARKQFEQALAIDAKFFPAAANLAQMDIQQGNPQAAKSRYETFLKADPQNVNVMMAIAEIEGRAGNEKNYLDWLNKAAKTGADAIRPRSLLAQYYLRKNEPAKALSLAREAYDAKPNNAATLELLGNVQLAAGEKQNAKDSFAKLVEINPASAAAHYKLAQSQIILNDQEPARKSLLKVLELDKDHVPARVDLSHLLSQGGQHTEALKQAHYLKQSQTNQTLGHMLEGDILMSQKNFTGALAAYEQANSKKPESQTLLKLAAALKASGKPNEADSRMLAWLKTSPDDHAVRLAYAESKMVANQYPEAASHYEYLNRKLPGQLMILNNLAYVYAQQRDKRAVTFSEQAYKLQPENSNVLDTHGWALVQAGQATKGLNFLQKALSKTPDAGDVQYHYAAALAASGDKKRAIGELNRLIASGTAFSMEQEARNLLAQLQQN